MGKKEVQAKNEGEARQAHEETKGVGADLVQELPQDVPPEATDGS